MANFPSNAAYLQELFYEATEERILEAKSELERFAVELTSRSGQPLIESGLDTDLMLGVQQGAQDGQHGHEGNAGPSI